MSERAPRAKSSEHERTQLAQERSKAKLQELIALACTYRGWTMRELAKQLDRDVHNLIPDSGSPKLDLVRRLADVLEWTIQEVADALRGEGDAVVVEGGLDPGASWADLDRMAFQAHVDGRFDDLVELATQGHAAARTPEERAKSCLREYLGFEATGRYSRASEAIHRGLRESEASEWVGLKLRTNLANCHYLLGNYPEAQGIATVAISDIEAGGVDIPFVEGSLGYARYVLGSCHRVFAGVSTPRRDRHARIARTLELAHRHRLTASGGLKEPWVVDHDDVREIAGTMARFPFRETGWQVLRSIQIADVKD